MTGNAPQELTLLIPANLDQEALQQAQVANLEWCETWLATLPEVADVPVARGLSYDLISFLNQMLIQDILSTSQQEVIPDGIGTAG